MATNNAKNIGVVTGSGNTFTFPASSDTLVGRATTDTLTNKTISGASNTLSNISLTSSVTGTLPVGNGGTGTGTSFTQGSVVFAGASGVYSQDNSKFFWDDSNIRLGIGNGSPAASLDISGSSFSSPANNAALAISTTQSLTKNDTNTRTLYSVLFKPTLNTGGSNTTTTYNVLAVDTTNTSTTGVTTNLLSLNYGGSNKMNVDSSGNITNAIWQGSTIGVSYGGTGAGTLTGVVIGNGTSAFTTKTNPSGAFVGDSDTQTLTNKTLTTPKISQINDANGNPWVLVSATASAVNAVSITNNSTGNAPTITVGGGSSDTNSDLIVSGKGTGKVKISAVYGALQSDTDGTTITFDMSVSNTHTVTLGGNRTLAVSNVAVGQCFMINLVQDGTGSRTVTWFSTIKWPGGTTPTLTTTASKTDVFGFQCVSSGNYLGYIIGQNL
jgi:hypothetical protein